MPFTIDGARVRLEGHCTVEEAPDLFQALIAIERPLFDLDRVAHMHAAVAQVLIASRGRLAAPGFTATSFALMSARDGVGGGPYVAEAEFVLG